MASKETPQPAAQEPAPMQRKPEKGEVQRAHEGGIGLRERTSPMSIVSMMQKLANDMDRFFGDFGFARPLANLGFEAQAWIPAIETFERDGRLVVRAELPGLKQDDVNVEVIGDEVVVSGERKQEERKEEPERGYYYSERRYGSFERRFTIPEGADPSTVEARFDSGVLEVSIALPEEKERPKRRSVEIKSAPEGGTTGSIH